MRCEIIPPVKTVSVHGLIPIAIGTQISNLIAKKKPLRLRGRSFE
jgi:hypothetical protein